MRKLIAVVLGAALLAGCAAAPAASESAAAASGTAQTTPAPTEEPTTAEDPAAYDTTGEQINVLDQLVDFGADTAGGSLKTAKAAAVLVEYLSFSDFGVLAVGFIVSFVVAYASILWFLKFLNKYTLTGFAVYRFFVALFAWFYFF